MSHSRFPRRRFLCLAAQGAVTVALGGCGAGGSAKRASPTPTPTPLPSGSPTPTPDPSGSPAPTPTPTASPTPTPSPSPNPTLSEGLWYYRTASSAGPPQQRKVDLCVYGATVAGIAAAIQARRMGRSVVLLAFSAHLGGMTSSGLGASDVGIRESIGGISREFYRRVGAKYGLSETFYFEPRIAETVLRDWCKEEGVIVLYQQRLAAVVQQDNRIVRIETEGGHTFEARYFVDATYEGDLLAAAGVSVTVGRESNSLYGETLNGIRGNASSHEFMAPVDPYIIPGEASSGLLPFISPEPLGTPGAGDTRTQAYCFRLCVTWAANRIPFPRPADYDASRYELLRRYITARGGYSDTLALALDVTNGRAEKFDMNNFGAFSLDNTGGNHDWATAGYAQRESVFQEHVRYQQGLLHFLANDARLPDTVREEARKWGLHPDEFRSTGGWPRQLYIREARRMVGATVMTQRHVQSKEIVSDAVAFASYTADSHHCRRIVVLTPSGPIARNEGGFEVGVSKPWGISYRALVPRENECSNLLAGICISASHVAWGSLRMEPVFFMLGQAAATAACLSMAPGDAPPADSPLQRLDTATLQERLKKDGQILP